MIEFRWVAFIALWTLLSGPIFSQPSGAGVAPQQQSALAAVPAAK